MSPSSTVHGGQHGIKHVVFELLLHAPFVADVIWGDALEPGCITPPLCSERFAVFWGGGKVLWMSGGIFLPAVKRLRLTSR